MPSPFSRRVVRLPTEAQNAMANYANSAQLYGIFSTRSLCYDLMVSPDWKRVCIKRIASAPGGAKDASGRSRHRQALATHQ
jgi:hypothetical protein